MAITRSVVLSIVVGLAAFVVTTIWAGELSETLQKYKEAIDRWDRTDETVLQSSTVISNAVTQGRDSLDQMSRLLDTELFAVGDLFRDGVTYGTMPQRFGKMLDEGKTLNEEAKKVVTPDNVVLIAGKMGQLIKSASVLGGAIRIRTEEERDNFDKRRTFVKYGGYVLGILSIIVAGIASKR
jgi:hypothetical protein